MIKLILICVGALKEAYEKAACEEYLKRLKTDCAVTVVELPAASIKGESDADVARVLKEESVKILAKCEGTVIALSPEGKEEQSEQFAERLKRAQDAGDTLTFIIGGSHGLDDAVKRRADALLSFSKMTFPHRLFRVMLLEQLYRGVSINKGKKYHK